MRLVTTGSVKPNDCSIPLAGIDRLLSVGEPEAGWRFKCQPKIRVREPPSTDQALRWIIAEDHSGEVFQQSISSAPAAAARATRSGVLGWVEKKSASGKSSSKICS